jgi:outer membrane protein assembly factor BamB
MHIRDPKFNAVQQFHGASPLKSEETHAVDGSPSAPLQETFASVSSAPSPVMKKASLSAAAAMTLDENFSTLTWKAALPCHFMAQPVAGPEGGIFMGSDNGSVTRFNESTGAVDWRYVHQGSKKMTDPLLSPEGELAVVADSRRILVLDSRTGEEKSGLDTEAMSLSAPVWGPEGKLVMMSIADGVFNKNGSIYSIDSKQAVKKSFFKRLSPLYRGDFGKKVWEHPIPSKSLDPSAVNIDGNVRKITSFNGMVLYAEPGNRVSALDEKNGEKKWSFTVDDPVHSTGMFPITTMFENNSQSDPFVIDRETVGVSSRDKLYALDAEKGTLRWSVNCGNIFGTASSDGKGLVFYRPAPDKVAAVEGGTVKWTKEIGFSPLMAAPATDPFGGVYVASKEGDKTTILALDGESGELKFKLRTGGDVQSAPVITGDGRIYVKIREGDRTSLCCFESPFNPEVAGALEGGETLEEGEGWIAIGDVKLRVNRE